MSYVHLTVFLNFLKANIDPSPALTLKCFISMAPNLIVLLIMIALQLAVGKGRASSVLTAQVQNTLQVRSISAGPVGFYCVLNHSKRRNPLI